MTDRATGEISPFDYAATGNGIVDDTATLIRALDTGRHVDLKGGIFRITAPLTMEDFQWLKNGKLIKDFAGDLLNMTAQQCALEHIEIDGNGTAGRCVIINAIGTNTQRQHMRRAFIGGAIGYALEFTNDFAGALFTCDDCAFNTATPGLEGVKLPTDTVGGFPGRWFYNCHQGGNPFIDVSNARGTRILGGSSTKITFDAGAQYATIKNHRLAFSLTLNGAGHIVEGCDVGGTVLTINGSDHIVGGNVYSGNGLTIGNGTTGCTVRVDDSTFFDANTNAQPSNRIYGQSANPPPVWSSNGTPPTPGNTNLVSRFLTEGAMKHLAIEMTVGNSGVALGTGAYIWRFGGPFNYFPLVADAKGSATFFDSSATVIYRGTAAMYKGSNDIFVEMADGTGNYWGSTAPVVPAAGDVINIDLTITN